MAYLTHLYTFPYILIYPYISSIYILTQQKASPPKRVVTNKPYIDFIFTLYKKINRFFIEVLLKC